jgi:hypothetical protein
MNSIYLPVMDNGMGLSRTRWAFSMMRALLSGCLGKGRKVSIESFSFPYPDGNANIATASFLSTTLDEIVFIDTDLVFQPSDVEMLLSHDVQLVSGIYAKKKLGLEYPIVALESDPEPFKRNGSDLVEVECVPRGFLRVHRDVFELMKPHVPEYECAQTGLRSWEFWKNRTGGCSDDFMFCKRYRELGGKVLVDKRIQLLHDGSALYPIKGTYADS